MTHDSLDEYALKKLAPVAENFQLYLYEQLGRGNDDRMLKITGCVMRAAKKGPRKGQFCIPVKGTERSVFIAPEESAAL